MHTTKNYGGPDRFRMAAALLVIAIHTSPLMTINESADFFLTRVLARIAVPFFFMLTGQFVVTHFLDLPYKGPAGNSSEKNPAPSLTAGEAPASGAFVLKKFLKKMGLLYGFCILLYLPLGIYAKHYQKLNPGTVLRMLLFDGTFYHLWYFPACIIGVLLLYLLSRFLRLRAITAVSGVLYVVGLLGDSYYGLIQQVPVLETVYDFIFQAFSYTRNGLFLAPLFLILGVWAGTAADKAKDLNHRPDPMSDCMGLVFSFAMMCGEAFLLRHLEWQRHDSMYLMLIPTMFFLYQCLLASDKRPLKSFRIASAWIYILHPAFIVAVRAAARPLQLTALLVENNLVHYLAVTLLSVIAGILIACLQLRHSARSSSFRKSRAQKIGEICDLIDMEEQNRNTLMTEEDEIIETDAEELEQHASHSEKANDEASIREKPMPERPSAEEISRDKSPVGKSASGTAQSNGEKPDAKEAPAVSCKQELPSKEPPKSREAAKPVEKPKILTEQSGLSSEKKRGSALPNSENPASSGKRAWIELDPAALEQNVAFLRSLLPEHCRLMPAVKADAYGHGAVITARLLNGMGVDAFCVACIAEGIALREAGIKGGILILGYTSPEDFYLLRRYHLTQTVVDYDYARQMNRFGNPLHVHLGIDTGMHRLGIRCENMEEIQAVCEMTNLSVDGFFTHLSVSDSLLRQDVLFTEAQIQAFYQVIRSLRKKGYPCRGLHLLASYGILNLLADRENPESSAHKAAELHAAEYSRADEERDDPAYGVKHNSLPETANAKPQNVLGVRAEDKQRNVPGVRAKDKQRNVPGTRAEDKIAADLAGDFVRPGIALYGILSNKADSNTWRNFLQPVLSLKARVVSVRPLYTGEATGYGAAFTAKRDMRIATLSIGYADGLPRELSYGKGSVLINGYRAPILGRICMDQTIVDVSRIPRIKQGDTAVIIGKSGKLENTADSLATHCGTITNELLSRLGSRLDRFVL